MLENIEISAEMLAEAFLSGDWEFYSDLHKDMHGRRPSREEWEEFHGK